MVAKRGTFLLIPHGPNINSEFKNQKSKVLEILLDELKKITSDEKTDFIRISPIWERNEKNEEIFKKLGFKLAPIHAHPEASWKLDIRPSEEELLKQMRKTTRYLIRQALKNKDMEIFQSSKIDDVENFNKIYLEVVKFQHFVPFSFDYLKNEFLAFQPDNQIALFFGKYKEEIVASAFVIFWSKMGFYHHAALLPKFHKIPIAYYLLWEAIKEAKKRDCILFDFWGYVDPFKNSKHPWAGPTLFKMGFGGKPYEYLKTQDLPLSKKYWLTYIFERLRRLKRGL
jgi:lipid II:glycine glycyltransferase (peptidoglycan interpeptide bridge formation enzyme)